MARILALLAAFVLGMYAYHLGGVKEIARCPRAPSLVRTRGSGSPPVYSPVRWRFLVRVERIFRSGGFQVVRSGGANFVCYRWRVGKRRAVSHAGQVQGKATPPITVYR